MTKHTTLKILYIGILMATLFVELPYSKFIIICASLVFFGYQIFEYNKIANTMLDGEFILRRQIRIIRPIFVIMAVISTLSYFINGRIIFPQFVLFWSIVLFDVVINAMTHRLKPIAMVVTDHKLVVNDLGNSSRDLNQLKALKLDGLTNTIAMSFAKEKKLQFKRTEYLELDIEKLIDICIERSKEHLSLSDNLKK